MLHFGIVKTFLNLIFSNGQLQRPSKTLPPWRSCDLFEQACNQQTPSICRICVITHQWEHHFWFLLSQLCCIPLWCKWQHDSYLLSHCKTSHSLQHTGSSAPIDTIESADAWIQPISYLQTLTWVVVYPCNRCLEKLMQLVLTRNHLHRIKKWWEVVALGFKLIISFLLLGTVTPIHGQNMVIISFNPHFHKKW